MTKAGLKPNLLTGELGGGAGQGVTLSHWRAVNRLNREEGGHEGMKWELNGALL